MAYAFFCAYATFINEAPGLVWEQWLRWVKCHAGGRHWVLTWGDSCWSSWLKMSAHTNMWSRTSSAFSLQIFAFLETGLCPAASKGSQEKAAGVGCAPQCHAAAQSVPAAADVESSMSFSIAAKSRKRLLNSTVRDAMSAAYLFVCAPIMSCGKLSMTSRKAGKCGCWARLWQVSLEMLQLGLHFMCAYSWLTTASWPWRLTFSAFRCFVVSTKRAKPASSCIGCPFWVKNSPISSWREKILCSVDPRLSHLTSLWCNTSPYSAWMVIQGFRVNVFITGFKTWSNLSCFVQRTC